MQLREIVGWTLVVLAIALAGGSIWAARYFSPMRRYGRIRAAERKAARERESLRKVSDDTQSASG